MVHVSKRDLPAHLEKTLLEQLSSIIVAQNNTRTSKQLVYELFSKSERMMLIKRLGIIFLLNRGYSIYSIAHILKVSESTVARIQESVGKGLYRHTLQTIKQKEYRESVLGMLESLIKFGLPGGPQKKLKNQLKKDIESWRHGGI